MKISQAETKKALEELEALQAFAGDSESFHSRQDDFMIDFIRKFAPEVAAKIEEQRTKTAIWFA